MTTYLDQVALALAEVAAGQVIPVPLFPLGDWKSAKYPSLPLTRDLADELIANFEAGVLGTEPVLDSSGRHDTSAPAAGWFKRLYVAPTKDGAEMLFGDAEITDLGAEQLNAGLYKYDSIELGPVVDNTTGAKTDNVFRSATLTNTPVLRMLPAVLDAADAIAMSEAVEIALSEITLADTEDDGDPAVPTDGSSDDVSQPAKVDEGQDVTLAEGDAVPKGSDPMKSVALKLNLAEDATEEIVLAEVVKLSDERDEAVTKLAEVEKAKRDAEIEATLTELIDGAHILPGQKDAWAKLAEDSPESFAVFAVNAKKVKAIQLGEAGTSEGGEIVSDDPTVELDKAAKKLAEERHIPYGEATTLVLAEDEALASRYANRTI